ncbi:Putative Ca2+/H+ antiporter, TMEM165/GDT1 family [Alkalithermobacter thermoalcaliphilus JW-YL-7 = DSM 7308]|uniref:GDT1 family protein n=1 Tax=Alkalithermobacter thermoalcaliphilus JW-YL-7 = DSM 7308 TaxID=1121328 RepID=A0A150FU06_CLOPD|nr:protein of unknown function UPF0016 [[Clostridium] paradoxum JW-YL-7 = DSM 7308]SHL18752.1 Putative Ca2+/H+ antiporter, TMEM165/GDT1 family [[Clostridium] paradoxum JW-YL-7 = DSM 7308]
MKEFLTAFSLITLAEMGDKTQLLALAFASKFSPLNVLLGIFIGSFINHGIAIAIGNYISKVIPINTVQLIASLLFIFFGLWSLKIDYESENEDTKSNYGPIITVALAFFIGELGDKTQLTAMTLGANSSFPILVLLGTVSAMVFTGGMGIVAGKILGKKIPEVTMKIIASFVFLFFGSLGLYSNLAQKYITPLNILVYLLIISALVISIIKINIIKRNKYYQNELAQILTQCKSCKEKHFKSCVVNIKREEIEKEYLGENIPFFGDIISYFESLKNKNYNIYHNIEMVYSNKKR